MDDRLVYVTQTYDYLPGPLPAGWQDVKTVWLDANQCWTGEVPAPKETGAFTVASEPWISNVEGRIIDAVGVSIPIPHHYPPPLSPFHPLELSPNILTPHPKHLHDGGISVEVLSSPTTSVCTTNLNYGETPAFKFTGTMMGDDKPAEYHISSVDRCQIGEVKDMKRGQSWIVKGRYDYDIRAGNIEEGKQGNVMAISIVLVAVPGGGVKSPELGWIGWAGQKLGSETGTEEAGGKQEGEGAAKEILSRMMR